MFLQNIFSKNKSNKGSAVTHYRTSYMICPTCQGKLEKEVKAKSTCPHCGKYIYKRTLPKNKISVNVNDEGLDWIDLEWAKVNGNYKEVYEEQQEYKRTKTALTKSFGFEPKKNDVLWSILNKKLLSAKDYRERSRIYLEMALVCYDDKKWVECIIYYSLCGYSDIKECRKYKDVYNQESLRNHHYLDTNPVTYSLDKLGKSSELETLIGYVLDSKTNERELISKVGKLLRN